MPEHRQIGRMPNSDNSPAQQGTNWLLVIGIDKYTHHKHLNKAVADAKGFADVMTKRYGFKHLHEPLYNEEATRRNILEAMSLCEKLGAHDRLILFYAGHGWYKPKAEVGYIVPTKADSNPHTDFIATSSITDIFKDVDAKHILLIVDCCFGGSFGAERTLIDVEMTQKVNAELDTKRSRMVLSSGGITPVSDGLVSASNSPFTTPLLDILQDNRAPLMVLSEVISALRKRTYWETDQQMAQYKVLQGLKHGNGELGFYCTDLQSDEERAYEVEQELNSNDKNNTKLSNQKYITSNILLLKEDKNDVERYNNFVECIKRLEIWQSDNINNKQINTAQKIHDARIFRFQRQSYYIEVVSEIGILSCNNKSWLKFKENVNLIKGKYISILCLLGNIDDQVIVELKKLNDNAYLSIFIDINKWRLIKNNNVLFIDYISFVSNHVWITNDVEFDNMEILSKWVKNKQEKELLVKEKCDTESLYFINRFKHKDHDRLYIERELDRKVNSLFKNLKPSLLNQKLYAKRREDDIYQICILRDFSGSGKTTFSVNIAQTDYHFFNVTISADYNEIDKHIINFFRSLGEEYGLQYLIATDKPLIILIDSLDEASNKLLSKRKELNSILTFIEKLNNKAVNKSYLCYPVLFIFTVRETFWRDWETVFEGRKNYYISKKISQFSNSELDEALEKYSRVYGYTIKSNLTVTQRNVLSIPINLRIFSEAFKNQGDIFLEEVWGENVVDLYFERKSLDILKRDINGLNHQYFMKILANLAFEVVKSKKNFFSYEEFYNLISNQFQPLINEVSNIIEISISEYIFASDPANNSQLKFTHSRFIEYLFAYYSVNQINLLRRTSVLENLMNLAFDSGVISMFKVHDDIKVISKKFPDITASILDYYSSSVTFLNKKLLRMRSELSVNSQNDEEDIKLIIKNFSSQNAELVWDTFFVVVAKKNNQSKENIISVFNTAWKLNIERNDRWKMLPKLNYHKLLLDESIVTKVFNSECEKEIELFLGIIYDSNLREEFLETCKELDILEPFKSKIREKLFDWTTSIKLLEAILNNRTIIKGDFY